ncbi:MAG: hypothetical protein NTX70_03600, partial [Verrucomicrobia bacterium]|nr:hypothetical protein [Verrucomicrobiota bacterium]
MLRPHPLAHLRQQLLPKRLLAQTPTAPNRLELLAFRRPAPFLYILISRADPITRLRSQHVEANYRLRSQVRHLTDEIPRLERRLEALRQDLGRRVDTRGDRFSIQLGNQTLTDRGIVGELLNRLGERSRELVADKLVGRFAGFDLLISPMLDNEIHLVLRGAAQHSVRLKATAHGTTRAVEHVVNHLDETAGQTEEFLAQSRKRLADIFRFLATFSGLVARQGKFPGNEVEHAGHVFHRPVPACLAL